MLSTIHQQGQYNFDPATKALHIEQIEGDSPLYGDFGRDPRFRRSLLEYLKKLNPNQVHQIIVRNGSVEFVYGEIATTKITQHAKTVSTIINMLAIEQQKNNPIPAIITNTDLIYSNIFDYYLRLLFERKAQPIPLLNRLYSQLSADPIIQEFHTYYRDHRERSLTDYYALIITYQRQGTIQVVKPTTSTNGIILDQYPVGLYNIEILDQTVQSLEKDYSIRFDNSSLYSQIRQVVLADIDKEILPLRNRVVFRDLQDNIETLCLSSILRKFPQVTKIEAVKYANLFSYDKLGFGKLYPLLHDNNVNEIYSDGPGNPIYLDHARWGRCRTKISLTPSDFEIVTTRIRLEASAVLDNLNPSLKTELSTKDFRTRISLDIPPLAVNGPYLDIRKFFLNPLSIFNLIRNNTISTELAAFLLLCIQARLNIITIGSPGSGKTTLINALDMMTPSNWRKVAIEDTIEGINQTSIGNHHIQLQVGSGFWKNTTKTTEIIKLLHRTPDYLFLGEIQTKEHSQALFHALNAGLKGIQTCHADSPEGILLRWAYHHNIPIASLPAIDIIIQMRQHLDNSPRRIERISELSRSKIIDVIQTQIPLPSLVKEIYCAQERITNSWQDPFVKAEVIQKFVSSNNLTSKQIRHLLNRYKQYFERELDTSKSLAQLRVEFDTLYHEYLNVLKKAEKVVKQPKGAGG